MKKIILTILTPLLLLAVEKPLKELTKIEKSTVEKAHSNGMKGFPNNKKEFLALLENQDNKITPLKYALGKALYFDPRLSKSQLISCNTCHNLSLGGVDGVSAAIGHKWAKNPSHLNSPTVYNAVLAESQFWDGRVKTLEEQAIGPIQAEPEMFASKEYIKEFINNTPVYLENFRKIKKDKNYVPDIQDVGDVIAIFERALVTPSRYDDLLNKNTNALTKKELKGLNTFIDKGCTSCHNGYALGGGMQTFPLIGKYKYQKFGNYTGKNGMIKVPTLRNVLITAPYFHNGKVNTIEEAIEIMGETQLGTKLTSEEVSDIKEFFKSLNGIKPGFKMPLLPETNMKLNY